MPLGHSSGRSKPRASQACTKCRQRKIKCIGLGRGRSCESCKAQQVPCTMSEMGDGRRHGTREQFDALQARLRHLESILADQGNSQQAQTQPETQSPTQPQPHPQSQPEVQTDRRLSTTIPRSPTHVSVASPLSPGGYHPLDESSYVGMDVEGPSLPVNERVSPDDSNIVVLPSTQHSEPPVLPSTAPQPHSHHQTQASSSTIDRQQTRAARPSIDLFCDPTRGLFGTDLTPGDERDDHLNIMTADGEPSYYGPTSQRYVKDHEVCGSDHIETIKDKGPAIQLKHNAAPSKNFLLQIFFRAQPLSTPVVNQTLFEAGRAKGVRAQWYSAFLENAMLACASRMSTSHGLRQSGAHHADCAKQAFLDEISAPNIATLQGLLLLSDFEATRGKNRLGYIYCGIASRLVFDLGLTASCTALIAQGRISQADVFERHRLLLAAHVFDKLWSVYMGRPSAIPTAMVAVAHERMSLQGWECDPSTEGWVGLCTDLSNVTEILLTNPEAQPVTVERLRSLKERLTERFNSLPEGYVAALDEAFELQPSAYALCIQFHGALIVLTGLLNRTNSSSREDIISGHPAGRQQSQQPVEPPCQEMLSNAIAIARLVSTYQEIYGIENVVTVMLDNVYIASAVLVSHILHEASHQEPSTSPSRHWLETLRDTLYSARIHYPVAIRMCSTLAKTVQNTILEGIYDVTSQTGVSSTNQTYKAVSSRPNNLTPTSDSQAAFRYNSTSLEFPTHGFDDDPMLGDIFGEDLSGGPSGNLMDWLSLGLDTGGQAGYRA